MESVPLPVGYYTLAKGRALGVYKTWETANQQLIGFKGVLHKAFRTCDEAMSWIHRTNAYDSESEDSFFPYCHLTSRMSHHHTEPSPALHPPPPPVSSHAYQTPLEAAGIVPLVHGAQNRW
jgi:Caulimovirus viroplasmin